MAQGYSQVKGVDYEEVFSPVARYTVNSIVTCPSYRTRFGDTPDGC